MRSTHGMRSAQVMGSASLDAGGRGRRRLQRRPPRRRGRRLPPHPAPRRALGGHAPLCREGRSRRPALADVQLAGQGSGGRSPHSVPTHCRPLSDPTPPDRPTATSTACVISGAVLLFRGEDGPEVAGDWRQPPRAPAQPAGERSAQHAALTRGEPQHVRGGKKERGPKHLRTQKSTGSTSPCGKYPTRRPTNGRPPTDMAWIRTAPPPEKRRLHSARRFMHRFGLDPILCGFGCGAAA